MKESPSSRILGCDGRERNLADGLVTKSQIVGREGIRIPAPMPDAGAIRLQRMMTYGIRLETGALRGDSRSAAHHERAVGGVQEQKKNDAERNGNQNQKQAMLACLELLLLRVGLYRNSSMHSSSAWREGRVTLSGSVASGSSVMLIMSMKLGAVVFT